MVLLTSLGGEPLGMETGAIPDENITASSSAGPAPPKLARLNGLSAWCAGKADDCFLQVRLPSVFSLFLLVNLTVAFGAPPFSLPRLPSRSSSARIIWLQKNDVTVCLYDWVTQTCWSIRLSPGRKVKSGGQHELWCWPLIITDLNKTWVYFDIVQVKWRSTNQSQLTTYTDKALNILCQEPDLAWKIIINWYR